MLIKILKNLLQFLFCLASGGIRKLLKTLLKIILNVIHFIKYGLIHTHPNEYQEVTNWLINYVDEVGKNLNKKGIENCKKLFKLGIEYEIGFWDSAWNFSNK